VDPLTITLGLLTTIALGISGWALVKVVSLGEKLAGLEARVDAQEGAIGEVKETLKRIDDKIGILLGLKKGS
jgi:hypothetical protein